jgi:mRNA interferase MazF
LIAGDVVLLEFPFSDLSGSKLRPAIVLAVIDRGDFIACQVATERHADPTSIPLAVADFSAGSLRANSIARPSKLFTAHRTIVKKRVARVKDATRDLIRDTAIRVIRNG